MTWFEYRCSFAVVLKIGFVEKGLSNDDINSDFNCEL